MSISRVTDSVDDAVTSVVSRVCASSVNFLFSGKRFRLMSDDRDGGKNPYLDRAFSVELVDEHGVVHVVEFYVEERDGSCVPLSTLYQGKGNTHTALSP